MPAFGISSEEINKLKKILKTKSNDAIIFVADKQKNAKDALKAIVERTRIALKFIPEETRAANPDGSSSYMRPRPGAARMYPETDVPPIILTKDYLKELENKLPELPEQIKKRLMTEYKINQKLTNQILNSEYLELFEKISKDTLISPTVIAVTLTETLKALKREGLKTEAITDEQFIELFGLINAGKTTKESIPTILTWLEKNEGVIVKNALKDLNLLMMSKKEIEELINNILEENSDFIKEKGSRAQGPIMGLIMKKARGRVQPNMINKILKNKLNKS